MDWEFKKNCRPVDLDEFWYDLTQGGYIDPSEILENQDQVKKLQDAIELVESFELALSERFDE